MEAVNDGKIASWEMHRYLQVAFVKMFVKIFVKILVNMFVKIFVKILVKMVFKPNTNH